MKRVIGLAEKSSTKFFQESNDKVCSNGLDDLKKNFLFAWNSITVILFLMLYKFTTCFAKPYKDGTKSSRQTSAQPLVPNRP